MSRAVYRRADARSSVMFIESAARLSDHSGPGSATACLWGLRRLKCGTMAIANDLELAFKETRVTLSRYGGRGPFACQEGRSDCSCHPLWRQVLNDVLDRLDPYDVALLDAISTCHEAWHRRKVHRCNGAMQESLAWPSFQAYRSLADRS